MIAYKTFIIPYGIRWLLYRGTWNGEFYLVWTGPTDASLPDLASVDRKLAQSSMPHSYTSRKTGSSRIELSISQPFLYSNTIKVSANRPHTKDESAILSNGVEVRLFRYLILTLWPSEQYLLLILFRIIHNKK